MDVDGPTTIVDAWAEDRLTSAVVSVTMQDMEDADDVTNGWPWRMAVDPTDRHGLDLT